MGSLAAAIPATATKATVIISAISKGGSTSVAPCAPAEAPSRPTPTITPVTARHSRSLRRTFIINAANTAVTARLDAITACTAKSGSRRSATSWARNPMMSMPRLARKRHWPSRRTSRPGSTRSAAGPPSRIRSGRRLAERMAMACMTAATP